MHSSVEKAGERSWSDVAQVTKQLDLLVSTVARDRSVALRDDEFKR